MRWRPKMFDGGDDPKTHEILAAIIAVSLAGFIARSMGHFRVAAAGPD